MSDQLAVNSGALERHPGTLRTADETSDPSPGRALVKVAADQRPLGSGLGTQRCLGGWPALRSLLYQPRKFSVEGEPRASLRTCSVLCDLVG